MTPLKHILWALGWSFLILSGMACGLFYYSHRRPQPDKAILLACFNTQSFCPLPKGGTLHFPVLPQHGKLFEIRLKGVLAKERPQVEFKMPDMNMGFNRYVFVQDGDDWKAVVSLPLCVNGRRDWLATLILNGENYLLPFSTH